jgi:hypothetical protein
MEFFRDFFFRNRRCRLIDLSLHHFLMEICVEGRKPLQPEERRQSNRVPWIPYRFNPGLSWGIGRSCFPLPCIMEWKG